MQQQIPISSFLLAESVAFLKILPVAPPKNQGASYHFQ